MGLIPSPAGKIGVMIYNDGPNTASSVAVEAGRVSMTRSLDTNSLINNQVVVDNSGVIMVVS